VIEGATSGYDLLPAVTFHPERPLEGEAYAQRTHRRRLAQLDPVVRNHVRKNAAGGLDL